MTMVPTQTISNHPQQENHHLDLHYGGYSNYNDTNIGHMSSLQGHDYCGGRKACIGIGSKSKPTPMAEEDSGKNSLNEAAGSSSQDRDEGWLQLSIGIRSNQEDPIVGRRPSSGELGELDLFQGGGSTSQQPTPPRNTINLHLNNNPPRPVLTMPHPSTSFSSSLLFQHQLGSGSSSYRQQDVSWSFRPLLHSVGSAPSFIPIGTYFSCPLQLHGGRLDVPVPMSSDFRVIDPPMRPLSSIWFMLQASSNQAKEPFLPQIPKSFLRIKDGRMTVRLLMKYLVSKLRLDSESELEITCRGQQLLPFLTLQHVRDNIWSPRDNIVTFLPDYSTTDHIMVLHYGRSD